MGIVHNAEMGAGRLGSNFKARVEAQNQSASNGRSALGAEGWKKMLDQAHASSASAPQAEGASLMERAPRPEAPQDFAAEARQRGLTGIDRIQFTGAQDDAAREQVVRESIARDAQGYVAQQTQAETAYAASVARDAAAEMDSITHREDVQSFASASRAQEAQQHREQIAGWAEASRQAEATTERAEKAQALIDLKGDTLPQELHGLTLEDVETYAQWHDFLQQFPESQRQQQAIAYGLDANRGLQLAELSARFLAEDTMAGLLEEPEEQEAEGVQYGRAA